MALKKSALAQVVQVGYETTPGTAVACPKLLQSLSIEPTASLDITTFRPQGQKLTTLTQVGKDYSTFKVDGTPTYDELAVFFANAICTPVVTTPATGTNSRQAVFTPSATAADTSKTWTLQKGDSVTAVQVPYLVAAGWQLSLDRNEVKLSGTMFGGTMSTGATLTSNPTAMPLVPILPKQGTIYLNDTYAAIGTTKLADVFSGDVGVEDKYGPVWTVDAAQTSIAGHVETEPKAEANITIQYDSVAEAILATARDGGTKFMRIAYVGPVIEGSIPHKLWIDMAVKVTSVADFSDEDGVYALGFGYTIVSDATLSGGYQVTIVNTQTAY